MHAPSADALPAGTFTLGAVGGYGFRNKLLSEDHKLTRGIGDLAFAYAPISSLVIALSFDGRYDKHTGFATEGDDGYVGDPRLLVRLARAFGRIHAGAQLGIWVPGNDAPSISLGATTVEARGLLSIKAGAGSVNLSAGFRLDNSAESAPDSATFTAEDKVSLGVSDFHAAVASLGFAYPAGKAFVGVEASTDVFVGSGAPGPIIRGGATAGFHLTSHWSVFAFASVAKVPSLDFDDVMNNTVTLIPYEPLFTGGLGITGRFGGRATPPPPVDDHITPNPTPETIEVIEYAEVTGIVLDDTGKPVAGAKVTLKLKNNTGTAATDGKGYYTVKRLPIGKTIAGKTDLDDIGAEVTVDVDGKKPKSTTLTLAKGANTVAPITLEPVLPPGQLKAVIRTAGAGKPIANATVKIEPGGHTATSDADGNISIDLPPGTYKATASGPGFKSQTLDVVIEKDGVVVKNFELRK
ncbi:MAG: carboxypeptidase regulatory-like domain-containing protein [Kofleriaceae bacterium]